MLICSWERSEILLIRVVLRSISIAMADCSSAAVAIWCDIWSMVFTAWVIALNAAPTFSISLTLRSARAWQFSMLLLASVVASVQLAIICGVGSWDSWVRCADRKSVV